MKKLLFLLLLLPIFTYAQVPALLDTTLAPNGNSASVQFRTWKYQGMNLLQMSYGNKYYFLPSNQYLRKFYGDSFKAKFDSVLAANNVYTGTNSFNNGVSFNSISLTETLTKLYLSRSGNSIIFDPTTQNIQTNSGKFFLKNNYLDTVKTQWVNGLATKVDVLNKTTTTTLYSATFSTISSDFTNTGGWATVTGGISPNSYGLDKYLMLNKQYNLAKRSAIARVTMGANTRFALFTKNMELNRGSASVFEVDAANSQIKIYHAYGDTTATLPTVWKTKSYTFVSGRDYDFEIKRDNHKNSIIIRDALTALADTLSDLSDSTGRQYDGYAMAAISGTFPLVKSLQVTTPYQVGMPFLVLGDSIVDGVYPDKDAQGNLVPIDTNQRFAQKLVNAIQGGGISGRGSGKLIGVTNKVPSELAVLKPKYAIILIGSNATSTTAEYTATCNAIIALGVTPILCNIPWLPGATTPFRNGYIQATRTALGLSGARFDIATSLNYENTQQDPSLFVYGSTIHPNAEGNQRMFNRFMIDCPELFNLENYRANIRVGQPKAIPYRDAAGILKDDSLTLRVDAGNIRMGKSIRPSSTVGLQIAGANGNIFLERSANTVAMRMSRYNGTITTPTKVLAQEEIGLISWQALRQGQTTFSTDIQAGINARAYADANSTSAPVDIEIRTNRNYSTSAASLTAAFTHWGTFFVPRKDWQSRMQPIPDTISKIFAVGRIHSIELQVDSLAAGAASDGVLTQGASNLFNRVPFLSVAQGGTGKVNITSGALQKGNGTGALADAVANTDYLPVSSPTMAGTPTTPTPASNINTTQVINGLWVNTYFTPLTRNITTGPGLAGGGDLSGDRTLTADTTLLQTKANSFSKAQSDAKYVYKAGDTFTGTMNTLTLLPTTDATYNLGSTSNRYSTVFASAVRTSVLRAINTNNILFQDNSGITSGTIYTSTRNWQIGTGTTDNGYKVNIADAGTNGYFKVGPNFTIDASGNAFTNTPASNVSTTQLINGQWVNTYYVPLTRTLTNGYGVLPIGDLSANRTVTVDTSTVRSVINSYSKAQVDVLVSGNAPQVLTGNVTLALNTQYSLNSTSQLQLTLPATAGFAIDGKKTINITASNTGGGKILVPNGYTVRGISGTAHTDGTGYITISQFQQLLIKPDVAANSYIYQVLSGSVTVY